MSQIGLFPPFTPHFRGRVVFPVGESTWYDPTVAVLPKHVIYRLKTFQKDFPDYEIQASSYLSDDRTQETLFRQMAEVFISKKIKIPFYLKPLAFWFRYQGRWTPEVDNALKKALIGIGIPEKEIRVYPNYHRPEWFSNAVFPESFNKTA